LKWQPVPNPASHRISALKKKQGEMVCRKRTARLGVTGYKKSNLFCHSERSEESLFDLSAGKERFLSAQSASE
jgi:hypothetical protein